MLGTVTTRSAGILLHHRSPDGAPRVLLGHMGGPFWASKDEAAWSIPKGEYADDERAEDAARREFVEELGIAVPAGDLRPLGDLRVSGGKVLTVWALEGDLDVDAVVPGTFELEWPPRSGTLQEFPEIDRAEWFDLATAATKLVKGQRPYLDRLAATLTPD
jgi:predicted NUDIX family NTP pyrophosphohydrolase